MRRARSLASGHRIGDVLQIECQALLREDSNSTLRASARSILSKIVTDSETTMVSLKRRSEQIRVSHHRARGRRGQAAPALSTGTTARSRLDKLRRESRATCAKGRESATAAVLGHVPTSTRSRMLRGLAVVPFSRGHLPLLQPRNSRRTLQHAPLGNSIETAPTATG